MFTTFAKTLYIRLVENGFELLQTMHDSAKLNESTEYIELSKRAGSALYLVFLINSDHVDLETHKKNAAEYAARLEHNTTDMNIRNVYISNILISQNEREDIKQLVAETEPFVSQPIYTTNFYAVLSESQVYASISKKDDFLHFREQIQHSFSPTDSRITEDFSELHKQEQAISSLAARQKNSGVVPLFIAIHIVLLILMEWFGGSMSIQVLSDFGALIPQAVFQEKEYYRLFSSLFLHIGLLHLIMNRLALHILGPIVERHLGTFRFLVAYLLAGFFGNVLSLCFVSGASAGASGAIFGLAGVLLALSQKTNKIIDGFSKQTLITYIAINLAFGFMAWNINNYAHIGGLVSGYVMGLFLYNVAERSSKEIRM